MCAGTKRGAALRPRPHPATLPTCERKRSKEFSAPEKQLRQKPRITLWSCTFAKELGSAVHVVLALEAQRVQELRVTGSSTAVSERC